LVALDIHPLCTQSLPDTEAPLRDAIRSICRAMAAFHSRGFAHRDVRWPSCLQHVSGQWCVADFELADTAGEPLPAEAIAEAFLPPEVLLDSGGLQHGSGNMYRIGRLCVEWSVARNSPHSAAAQQHVDRLTRPDPSLRPPVDALLQEAGSWLNSADAPSAGSGGGAVGGVDAGAVGGVDAGDGAASSVASASAGAGGGAT